MFRSRVTYPKNITVRKTVKIRQKASFQFCQLIEIKYEHGKGEHSYVHDFYDRYEKEKFKRNDGLSAGDLASLFLVLMPVSTRFMVKVELGQRANMETVDLKTYIELCWLNESLSPVKTGDNIIITSRSAEDNAYPSGVPLNCRQKHSMNSSGICTSFENDRNEVFCPSSQSNSNLALRSKYQGREANQFKFHNFSQLIKNHSCMYGMTDDF